MVTFYNGSTALGTQLLNSGQTTLVIEDADALGVGTVVITAQYQPDTNGYAPSSGTFNQSVNEPGVAVTNGNNTLTGNQTVNGALTATSLSGNGAGLTGLNPANLSAGTAATSITGNAATATTAGMSGGPIDVARRVQNQCPIRGESVDAGVRETVQHRERLRGRRWGCHQPHPKRQQNRQRGRFPAYTYSQNAPFLFVRHLNPSFVKLSGWSATTLPQRAGNVKRLGTDG
jgi:hypothetical protein